MGQFGSRQLRCMEVFGGNTSADDSLAVPGLDVFISSRPSTNTNGNDVHFVSSCATGRTSRFLLSDVAGTASDVDQTTNNIRDLMKGNVNYIDQSRFVHSMNQEFAGLTQSGRFATAVVLTYFDPTHDLTICNTGHPPPLFFSSQSGKWIVLNRESRQEESNVPERVASVTNYQQFGMKLAEGDIVFCYTDSLIESYGKDGELMGVPGLLKVVSEIEYTEAAEFVQKVMERVSSFATENLNDDASVVLLKCNEAAAARSLGERLVAPFRLFWEIIRSFGSSKRPTPWPELSVANIGGAVCNPLNRTWSKQNDGISNVESNDNLADERDKE